SLQLAVNEFFYETGQVPANLAALGITTPPQGHYIEHATLQNGAIILTYGQQANATLQQKTLRFTPYIHPDQSLIWRCQSALLPSNTHLAPGAQDQTLSSDILPDLLPQTCRP
ncbi:MAG: pilin, partial [Gammaproteobacteria bacterium]|nr:pilin [Gammaproteobacteria bacterium]